MNPTNAQKHNLLTLAEGLMTLPKHSKRFDMSNWKCGSAACAAGWAPVFVEPMNKDEKPDLRMPITVSSAYTDYIARVFGFFQLSDEVQWIFSGDWEGVDNTPWGAAARIIYYVKHNALPPDHVAQRYGEAPLSYLPPGASVNP